MSKQHHYIVSYNTERKEWELDADAEAVKYDNGTIYDYETDTWHQWVSGDGVFFPESERLGEIIGNAVRQLNKDPREGMCLNCDNFMVNEGHIEDDIQLCHGCYDRETLAKYYPQLERKAQ